MNMPLNTSADTTDPIAQARYNMVEQQIRPWNVSDARVLELLAQMPREQFVPPSHQALAFTDMEIPLHRDADLAQQLGQIMLAPRVEARMLQDLQIRPTDRILEIGAGSGFMAALLARSGAQVVTLEIDADLAEFARENLRSAGIDNVQVRQADGALDPIPDGPFDVIMLSGSVNEVPQRLLDLLADGGRLGAITGQLPMMYATFVRRSGNQFETTRPWDVVTARLRHFPEPSAFKF
ncbi:protein-L-isoaspartate O-methyltransferase [Comamonas faecalis]|uniref:Protein-L-isoaspartate O-methyltransferase n=1 Tax=Comamonas faecalis TaxID=1387849 RepID=A0ABP7R4M2_9BURK